MIDETLLEAEEKMEKAVEVAKEDFADDPHRRANPAMFNKLIVDYYGAPTPLQQLASFQTPEARTILITPFDKSAMARDREGAARLRPRREPDERRQRHPRSCCPQLTEERRKDYIKLARHKARGRQVSIRNIRRQAKDELDRWSRTARSARTRSAAPRRSSTR